MAKAKEYAIYKGDELLVIGTAEECAKKLNVKKEYIYWLTKPTAQKRLAKRKDPDKCMVGIRLDDEEDRDVGLLECYESGTL
jgi:K+/H+ antiporter YhaU regulatory subunit KhtT